MKYKINPQLFVFKTIDEIDRLKEVSLALKGIWLLLEAVEICLTEQGYNKFDDASKSLFIGIK